MAKAGGLSSCLMRQAKQGTACPASRGVLNREMSRTRKLIIAFWIFIVIMLLWQFYTYNQGLKQAAIDHPQQEHFYFFQTNAAAPSAPAPAQPSGPDVEQTAYSVEENTPTSVSFTCHVTLKNVGNAKAVNIQVRVRPYRGMRLGDEDVGNSTLKILDENDPLSQFGQWVGFPDLAPGESSTQSVIFLNQGTAIPVVPGVSATGIPGEAPEKLKPEIIFSPEKAQ
jgi:hypothetical protein